MMSINQRKITDIQNFIYGIKNFKSFNEIQKAQIKPLTIICGNNNSGKSTITQSLLMLSQSISEIKKEFNFLISVVVFRV